MAYIIAHGTVDGYRKITQMPPIGTEQSVLTDIRAEFDNTQTMLNKPCGYLIQMAENGVWISIVKLLFDGERSGNGTGFFAFSAFLPTNQVVGGRIIKQTLDDLLEHYLARIGDDFTKNVGIDWSFVEQASVRLNEQCQERNKVAKTNYYVTGSNEKKFAYVDVHSDTDIEQYLDKPFQPEYGEYRAAFLGTYLQHPDHLAPQTPLTIDFENEEYDIIWEGNSIDYPNLPKVVRKNQIASESYDFKKQCYKTKRVFFSEGKPDTLNATLTLQIPKLEPEVYDVKFSISHPDKVISLTATQSYLQPRKSEDDNKSLRFFGEEALQTWHVTIKTCSEFEDYECDIHPLEDAQIPNGKGVTLREVQTISLLIYMDGKEDTSSNVAKIKIENTRSNRSESASQHWDKAKKCLTFKIPVDEDFRQIYECSLYEPYCQHYSIGLCKNNEGTYEIRLTTIKRDTSPVKQPTRTIHIVVPKCIANQNIQVGLSGKPSRMLNELDKREEDEQVTYSYPLEDRNISRDEFVFATADGKRLSAKKRDGDDVTIDVWRENRVLGNIKKWVSQYYRYAIVTFVGFLLLLFLLCGVLLVLNFQGIINIKSWFLPAEPVETVSEGPNESPQEESGSVHGQLYVDLERFLEEQKDKWNYNEIYAKVKQCGNVDTTMDAYPLYKQLVWLQCRMRIDGYWLTDNRELAPYQGYQKWRGYLKQDLVPESSKNPYADQEKLKFLSEIVNAPETHQQNFFKAIKKERDAGRIQQKTFLELQKMWENCKNLKSSSNQNVSQEGSQNGGNNPPPTNNQNNSKDLSETASDDAQGTFGEKQNNKLNVED